MLHLAHQRSSKGIISSVPFFRDADQFFTASLSKVLIPQVVVPGEFVISKGDIGAEMVPRRVALPLTDHLQYFVTSGEVDICSADGKTVYRTLGPGSFFGEMALLERSRRTASVRARSYCDLYVLKKDDLDRVLTDSPEVRQAVIRVAQQRKLQNAERHKWEQRCRGDTSHGAGLRPALER